MRLGLQRYNSLDSGHIYNIHVLLDPDPLLSRARPDQHRTGAIQPDLGSVHSEDPTEVASDRDHRTRKTSGTYRIVQFGFFNLCWIP